MVIYVRAIFKGDTWTATVSIYSHGDYQRKGTLKTPTAELTYDSATGYARFDQLNIDIFGMYILEFDVTSTNEEVSSFSCKSAAVRILSKRQKAPLCDVSSEPNYDLYFEGDYIATDTEVVKAQVYNLLLDNEIDPQYITTYEGSVHVAIQSDSSPTLLAETLKTTEVTGLEGLTFKSATINGVTYAFSNELSSSTVIAANATTPTTVINGNDENKNDVRKIIISVKGMLTSCCT